MKCAHCTEINHTLPPSNKKTRQSLAFIFCIAALLNLITIYPSYAQEPQDKTEHPQNTQEESPEEVTDAPIKAPQPSPPPYTSTDERDMKLLAKELRDQETILWLNAIDGPFLALYEKEITTEPVGAVLILHAEGQHSNWPTTIELIRSSLPYYGWTTLATALPDPDLPSTPERTLPVRVSQPNQSDEQESGNATQEKEGNEKQSNDTKDTNSEQAATDEENELFDENSNTLSDGSLPVTENMADTNPANKINTEMLAFSRIEAAINHLNNLGIYNIVLLGDGIGAARAGHFLSLLPEPEADGPEEKAIKPIRAMVIINARNHSPNGDLDLTNSLFDPELPTLDIYFGLHQQDTFDSTARKKYALRSGFKTYQQVLLPELSRNTMLGENRLTRRVRGFLQKHAEGVKVDNAIVNRGGQ